MNDNFQERVKRLFGSNLFETVPKSSFPTSSWSVAVGEVERQEWNRDRGDQHDREDDPCSSAFYDQNGCLFKNRKSKRDKQREFEGDLGDLGDDEAEDDEEEREKGGEYGDAEREEEEIRSSVGRDPTLDNEEEEDEFDKAALCRENASDRVYMKDVKDHGPYINYHAVVPEFLDEPSDEAHHFNRDPRADHFTAGMRLKEDKSAGGSCPQPVRKSTEPSRVLHAKVSENDINVKPILKRKEAQADPKPKKRVRFEPEHIHDHDEVSEEPQDVHMLPKSLETPPSVESAGIPDYPRHPSKYTHYSLDSSEGGDEETNKRAFEDFQNLKRHGRHDLQTEYPVELPKSIIFTPRKKSVDAVAMDDSPMNPKEQGAAWACRGDMAAGEANESDACEMDEDDGEAPLADAGVGTCRGRKYRQPKSIPDDSS